MPVIEELYLPTGFTQVGRQKIAPGYFFRLVVKDFPWQSDSLRHGRRPSHFWRPDTAATLFTSERDYNHVQ